ncbi:hypothetical protein NEAUS03_0121 [Nematocida ausubeli]|nr:hypothetical protein NEAUS03_0121 [Nematocida ausubeli]
MDARLSFFHIHFHLASCKLPHPHALYISIAYALGILTDLFAFASVLCIAFLAHLIEYWKSKYSVTNTYVSNVLLGCKKM